MATRGSLRTLVISATGRNNQTTLLNSALDLAVAEVSAAHLWSDLESRGSGSIDDGTTSLALASDLARLTEVRIVDTTGTPAWKLELRKKTWLLERYPNPPGDTTGRPGYGYLEGTTLYFIPVPNDTYTVQYTYYKLHPAFVNDASTLLIRQADAAVVAYANFWVFQSLERNEQAKLWAATYAAALQSAIVVDRENTAVEKIVDTNRVEDEPIPPRYWEDPFVRSMP